VECGILGQAEQLACFGGILSLRNLAEFTTGRC